ncbi:cytochrome c-type biogenesis protein CcmH [uncultured Ferrimonas sp.]|uniref:cytochrome c-type biogenesis protein n=1 Tax=uncultured Ferrimonas sp. TaxID=432640 RepID=UPI002635302D|nr:cytochrome c-type biogenesis protein CcmH [uncultured Ferrimonas sp.]
MLKTLLLTLLLLAAPQVAAEPQPAPEKLDAGSAHSAPTGAELNDAVNAIAAELRCPASVNLNLLESEAPIAYELKGQIAAQLQQGKSKQQIIDRLVLRYGPQIHYQPAFAATTAPLWILPLVLVGLILLMLLRPTLRSTFGSTKSPHRPRH